MEIVPALAEAARERLAALGCRNVTVRCGDGYLGWPEQAPVDLIVVAAAPAAIPPALVDQLAPGGRMVIPVGDVRQQLLLLEKGENGNMSIRPTHLRDLRAADATAGFRHDPH